MSRLKFGLVAAASAMFAASAGAAVINVNDFDVFSYNDTSASGSLTQVVKDKRALFDGRFILPVSTFNFEGVPTGTNPLTADFVSSDSNADIHATLSGAGGVKTSGDEAGTGRFNTSSAAPGRFWVANEGQGSMTITFDTAIAGFGFYGTDIGDFGGTLKLRLYAEVGDALFDEMTVMGGGGSSATDGSAHFFGFASRRFSYKKIEFVVSDTQGTAPDYFGFDDFVVADRNQIKDDSPPPPPNGAPEPASLALVGLALLGAAAARRRRA